MRVTSIIASACLAVLVVVAACGGKNDSVMGPARNDEITVDESDVATDTCCCSREIQTADGSETEYESMDPMSCSEQDGDCMGDGTMCVESETSDGTGDDDDDDDSSDDDSSDDDDGKIHLD